jgi:transposase
MVPASSSVPAAVQPKTQNVPSGKYSLEGVSIGEAARALEVNPNVLHRWRREFRQGPGNVFPGNGKQRWSEGRIAELERKIGQQALEIDFLKGCLQRIEEQRMLQVLTGNPRSIGRSRKK